MQIQVKVVQSSKSVGAGRPKPRFHCETCGQPVAPGEWIRMAFVGGDRNRSYLACPVCLHTQHLLPPVRRT